LFIRCLLNYSLNLNLNACWRIKFLCNFRELLHSYLLTIRQVCSQPYKSNAALTKTWNNFVSLWASVAVLFLFIFTKSYFLFLCRLRRYSIDRFVMWITQFNCWILLQKCTWIDVIGVNFLYSSVIKRTLTFKLTIIVL